MKGISYCDECANYDWENERCNKGASIEDDYGRIYQDCPLPDAEPVRHGKWLIESDGGTRCSACKRKVHDVTDGSYAPVDLSKLPYCPKCGCRMDGE